MIPRLFLMFCLLAQPLLAFASEDILVVVNHKSALNQISRDEVINLFLGHGRQLVAGVEAQPLDLPNSSSEKAQFYARLTGKSVGEINAYWARLLFSGRAVPPKQMNSPLEVMQLLAGNPRAVGYVARSQLLPAMKIIFELPSHD